METRNKDLKEAETRITVREAIKNSVGHYERTMEKKVKDLKVGSGVEDVHIAAVQEAIGEFRSNTEQIQHFKSYPDYVKEAEMVCTPNFFFTMGYVLKTLGRFFLIVL